MQKFQDKAINCIKTLEGFSEENPSREKEVIIKPLENFRGNPPREKEVIDYK